MQPQPHGLPAWSEQLGGRVTSAVLLAGGASKEAWAIELDGEELVLRRASVGVIHRETLSLEHEFQVIRAAHEAGVGAPRPVAYYPDLDGREGFTMERIRGETIGRRIVRDPPAGLETALADELARVHAIPPARLPFLAASDPVERLRRDLDTVDEPHPAIELGLTWADERLPRGRPHVVCHGDFRVGNLVIGADGLRGVLDWEFAHLGDPVEDLAWPLVRAWRFGAVERRLGGIGSVEPYVHRYAELTGVEVTAAELYAWEVLGNAKWATGCLTQSRRHLSGQDRSVEYAVLGRMAAEMEYELLHLIAHA
jgi:aminoglycoside phosphotransferase (APT) family kinase protein